MLETGLLTKGLGGLREWLQQDPWPGGQQAPLVPSEEAGAPQAMGLAQVGRQRAAHVLGGGADALGCLDGPAQSLVELLQVLRVQLDGVPVSSGRPGGGCGGPLSGWSG